MDQRDFILKLIREKGPLLPSQFTKDLGTNTILVGAMLSELVANKKLKISHAKIGGSPVYFLPGQEEKLEMLYNYLHEKEKKAYNILKENLVLNDKEQLPVIRAALRELKDFAVPLNVKIDENNLLFWKWYLISNDEASELIKKKLGIEEKKEDKKKEADIKREEEKYKEIEDIKKSLEKERQEILKLKEELLKKSFLEEKPKKEIQKTIVDIDEKETDEFLKNLKKKLEKEGVEIISYKILRKNSEVDLVINMPTALGIQKYFCKAKNKKTINEGDLASCYLSAQSQRLPAFFITTGEITKKALSKMQTDFCGMGIKQI